MCGGGPGVAVSEKAAQIAGTVAPGAVTALLQELVRAPAAEREDWAAWLRPGVVIGRFELLRELGRGGFGVVYEARDQVLGRAVAFKAVRVGEQLEPGTERLLSEAEAAARLSHPNLATLFDVGRSERTSSWSCSTGARSRQPCRRARSRCARPSASRSAWRGGSPTRTRTA